MGVYVFIEGYAHSDFGRGAAISMLMVVIVAALSLVLRRAHGADGGDAVTSAAHEAPALARTAVEERPAAIRRRRRRRLARAGWNLVGLAVTLVVVFPVFWMVSTAFKPEADDQQPHPHVDPDEPDARSLPARDRRRPASRVLGRRQEQPHRRRADPGARDGARVPRRRGAREVPLHGAKVFVALVIGILMLPQVGLIIPLYVVLAATG